FAMDASQSSHVLLNCPKCNRPMQVPQAGIGKRVRCPRCETTFVAKETEPPVEEGIVAEDVAPSQLASQSAAQSASPGLSPGASSPRGPRRRQPDGTWEEEESRGYRRSHEDTREDSGRDSEARSRSLYWILGGVFSALLLAGIVVLVIVLVNQKEPAPQGP